MKNVNRDYTVTVDAKTADIKAPKDMKFYITDVWTSNIFFKLEINESNNSLINPPEEDASNYKLTLRVVKPNNEPKEIEAVLLNQNSNFFVADLPVDFIDFIGIYQCELFIDTEINGRPERSTTNSFEYEVKKSIFNNLDDVIDNKYLSIDNIATIDYVNQLAFGNVDISGYVTTESMDTALATKADADHIHDGYATKEYVDNIAFSDVSLNVDLNVDLTGYATKEYVNNIALGGDIDLSEYATKEYVNGIALGNVDLAGYATKEYVDGAISGITGGSGGASYDDTELRNLIAGKSDTDHIHNEYATKDSPVFTGSISLGRKENTAVGSNSIAIGNNVTAIESYSYAEGNGTESRNVCSHAEGYCTIASGAYSHAECSFTTASGYYSHSEGQSTTASGSASHAEGDSTVASGTSSHTEGIKTIASSNYQHVQGKYNIEDTENKYAHIVGNGTSSTARSNAHTLDWYGNAWYAGDIYTGGTQQSEGSKLATESYAESYVDNKLWFGTQDAYDAITTKDPNIIYFIEEG